MSDHVGQAGQLVVNIAGNASADQLKDYLLTLPGLSSSTIAAVKNFSNWQYAIPLAIPTDRAGWSQTTVSGTYGGSGVILNDNTGIASAVVWQRNNGTQSLGVGGKGLTAAQVQSVASSLR